MFGVILVTARKNERQTQEGDKERERGRKRRSPRKCSDLEALRQVSQGRANSGLATGCMVKKTNSMGEGNSTR